MTVTTSGIRAKERVEFWADLVSRHVTPMGIEPSGPLLNGRIDAHPLGDLGLAVARVAGRGIRALHTDAHVGRATGHLYAACIHIDGDATITTHGVTTALRPGDLFITDSRRRFTLGLERPWRHLVLTLPCGRLDERVARPDALAGRVVRNAPAVRLWAAHLAAGFANREALPADAVQLFERHSVDMLGQLLDEATSHALAHNDAPRTAVRMSATHVIAARYRDATLNPQAIARQTGVSTRTLARAFAERGETVMQRVFDERVTQAAKLLRSPAWSHRSVTDIAFACGFNDLSHFGRLFAARLQTTPLRYRQRSSP